MVTAMFIGNSELPGRLITGFIEQYYPEITLVARADSLKVGMLKIDKFHPYLMFVDMELPDGLGCEIIEAASCYCCRVVFLSAEYHKMHEVLLPSYATYINKPLTRCAFVTTVSNLLPLKRNFNSIYRKSSENNHAILNAAHDERLFQNNNPFLGAYTTINKISSPLAV